MEMSDLQRYPLKLCLIKYDQVHVFLTPIFICGSLEHCLLQRQLRKFTEINTFSVSKMTIASTFLIRLRFQWYSCKSGIASFHWKLRSQSL